MKNQPLLPELISRDNDAYPIAEDLKEVLDVAFENKKIKNVYEKTILKMDNSLELSEKVEVKGKEKE